MENSIDKTSLQNTPLTITMTALEQRYLIEAKRLSTQLIDNPAMPSTQIDDIRKQMKKHLEQAAKERRRTEKPQDEKEIGELGLENLTIK